MATRPEKSTNLAMTMPTELASTASDKLTPSFLLLLPLELRTQIYHYLIPVKRVIDVHDPHFRYRLSDRGTMPNAEEDFSDSEIDFEEQPVQDTQELSELEIPDEDLSLNGLEPSDREFAPSIDKCTKDTVSFGGCTNSAYKILRKDQTTSWGTDQKKNSIFLVCKQVSNEALDIMYGENTFRLYLHTDGGRYLEDKFPEANRRRIRLLLLVAEHRSWIGEIHIHNIMWSSIIPTLNIVRFVVNQPCSDAPLFEKEMKSWLDFMRAFLNCVRQHLATGKVLEVDFDGKPEAAEIVEKCMPGRYREVRCGLSGDRHFSRGHFSWDSGIRMSLTTTYVDGMGGGKPIISYRHSW